MKEHIPKPLRKSIILFMPQVKNQQQPAALKFTVELRAFMACKTRAFFQTGRKSNISSLLAVSKWRVTNHLSMIQHLGSSHFTIQETGKSMTLAFTHFHIEQGIN